MYRAVAIWNDESKSVQVVEAAGSSLVGMAMLRDCQLHIDVVPGGTVTIEGLG
jgi:hypothetical protein